MINHQLNEHYDFGIVLNTYKYYLPNLMRHFGKVDKDQVPHSDYPYTERPYRKETVTKKTLIKRKSK